MTRCRIKTTKKKKTTENILGTIGKISNWTVYRTILLYHLNLLEIVMIIQLLRDKMGFPGGLAGREPACQCRKHKRSQVQSLGEEDPLAKEMATHSSILSWKIPWTEEPGRLQFMGSQRVGHDWTCTHSEDKREEREQTRQKSSSWCLHAWN